MQTRNKSRSRHHCQPALYRRGSTLLIVVALMGMLAFLGFAFYTLAVQERANALSFAQEAKTTKAPSLEPDALFDFALQQVILGPDDAYTQSILWGGRHSLMANMYGRDRVPFNGEGVNLMQTAAGVPQVDMDFNGTAETNSGLLAVVDSPTAYPGNRFSATTDVAWGDNGAGTVNKRFQSSTTAQAIPAPDVNYNSSDINSMFLSYDGIAVDATGTNPSRVVIPSYLRPQYLRGGAGGALTAQWYLNAPANQVMRPHPSHVCVNSSGNQLTMLSLIDGITIIPIPRFVSSNDPSGGLPSYQSLGLRRPFTSGSFAPETASGSPSNGNLGVWSWTPGTPPASQTVGQNDINLDVDTDGDGIRDAILMDLGYPPIRRGDGKLVVPLFAISIRDLNGLLNVNATGNLSGNLNLGSLTATSPSGGWLGYRRTGASNYVADSLSKSNQGLSPYEINILRALTADPTASTDSLSNSETAYQLSYFLQQFDTNIATTTSVKPGRSVRELANLEWLLLNIGRAQFHLGLATSASPLQDAITDMFSGRNGDLSRMRNFLTTQALIDMPRPGQSVTSTNSTVTPPTWLPVTADDNSNASEGELNYATRWVHPLDYLGSGQQYLRFSHGPDLRPGQANVDDDGNGVTDDYSEEGWPGSDDVMTGSLGKKPELFRKGAILWPSYSGYHSFGTVHWGEVEVLYGVDQKPGVAGVDDDGIGGVDNASEAGWAGSDDLPLMRGSKWYSLLDDPTEAIIDPTLMSPSYSGYTFLSNARDNDTVFGPEEMPFLQGSESDARLSDAPSRLAELMPANLVASSNAADIRKRLTTVSSDRREYGYGTSAVGGLRSWEVNRGYFPPTGPTNASPQNYSDPTLPTTNPSNTWNPYRAELFDLVKQVGNAGVKQAQFRLNVNRWLTNDITTPAIDTAPGYQIGFAALPQQTTPVRSTGPDDWNANLNTASQRQAMARDIYTLLYTLCLGQDADYRSATLLGLPSNSKGKGKAKGRKKPAAKVAVGQAQEMAQFAVNLVDALDPDDIPTAFYYDPDLQSAPAGDGWTVPDAAGKYYVVYGVERQSLAITEALAIRVNKQSSDSPMTIFDDKTVPNANDGLRYLFCELQNVTPMNVTLASSTSTSKTTASWRVTLEGVNGTKLDYLNSVYLLSGLDAANNQIQIDGSNNRYLPPGSIFTISSQDGTDKFSAGQCRTSDFRANRAASPTATGPFDLIAPSGGQPDTVAPSDTTDVTMFPKPKCNLDLAWNYGGGALKFDLETNSGTTGGFVVDIDDKITAVQLVLERLATDGNWVEVDRTRDITVQAIDPPTAPPVVTNTLVNTQLDAIQSSARIAPLDRTNAPSPTPVAPAPTSNVHNTLQTAGTSVTTTAWQWHLDRDFASLGEILQLPLYGPDDLTNGQITDTEFDKGRNDADTKDAYFPRIAAGRFLRPDLIDDDTNPSGNRWYRLLEFLEVPNRSHQHTAIRTQSALTTPVPTMLAEPYNLPIGIGWPRTHGQLNLNMIRHPQALAALLDDDLLINGATTNLTGLDEATRLWWVQFLKARDSRSTGNFAADPVTNLFVPGTGNSRPFRGFDAVGRVATSTTDGPLENTILRSLPLDGSGGGNPNEFRRLFEVGMSAEHVNNQDTVTNEADAAKTHLHPTARYRLLSKLLNNVTTRSNSFGVFVTVQYYEAAEQNLSGQSAPAIRIGGRLDDTPTHRGYFVVDRTGAVEQMKVLTANPVSSNSFSFKANTNQTGTPNGIRWKDLILFRKTLN